MPGCPTKVELFIDANPIRIKYSNLRKVAKLIDATNPPRGKDLGSALYTTDVCTVIMKKKNWKAIHHLSAE